MRLCYYTSVSDILFYQFAIQRRVWIVWFSEWTNNFVTILFWPGPFYNRNGW